MARSGANRKGTIDLTATVANACGLTVHGALINDAGATITVGGTAGARTLTAQLDNLGTLNVGLPLTINRGSADHRNLGTINVTGGDLTLAQSGTTPLFTMTMQGTQPASHGGRVFESVPGQLLGWPAVDGGAGAAP